MSKTLKGLGLVMGVMLLLAGSAFASPLNVPDGEHLLFFDDFEQPDGPPLNWERVDEPITLPSGNSYHSIWNVVHPEDHPNGALTTQWFNYPEGTPIVITGYLVTLRGAEWRDYRAQVTKYRPFSDDYQLLLRFQNLDNFIAYGRDGCCMVVEVVSGGQMIFRYWVDAPEFHHPETLSALIEGFHIKAYSDGNLMFETDLPQGTPMYGRIGLRTPHADPLFDNVFVYAIPILATVNIVPGILNLRSRVMWITAYIELPQGYDVADIDVGTVLLEGTVPAELHPTEVGDYDDDSVPDLMIKFDRRPLIEYLDGTTGEVTLTVSGELSDGTPFAGSDTITAINPGKK